jgi:phosphoribosylformylglycinamidine (FGAM) synthase-like amidotransferase family enzyme
MFPASNNALVRAINYNAFLAKITICCFAKIENSGQRIDQARAENVISGSFFRFCRFGSSLAKNRKIFRKMPDNERTFKKGGMGGERGMSVFRSKMISFLI